MRTDDHEPENRLRHEPNVLVVTAKLQPIWLEISCVNVRQVQRDFQKQRRERAQLADQQLIVTPIHAPSP